MNMKKGSVKGLANIATLINRSDLPNVPTAPKRERRTSGEIQARTMEKIAAAITGSANHDTAMTLISNFVHAAIRDSYNIGHVDALEQNSAVEKLLEKQYEARTKLTLPAAVAGIMEQRGLSSMTLDLAQLATVFSRNAIDYSIAEGDIIEYRLIPIDEV